MIVEGGNHLECELLWVHKRSAVVIYGACKLGTGQSWDVGNMEDLLFCLKLGIKEFLLWILLYKLVQFFIYTTSIYGSFLLGLNKALPWI